MYIQSFAFYELPDRSTDSLFFNGELNTGRILRVRVLCYFPRTSSGPFQMNRSFA